jgi:hypothetical protein
MGETEKATMPPQAVLGQMINGYWASFSILAAVRGAWGAERVAAEADTLYRLLRALASIGVFHEEGDRTFLHTPLSSLLKKDVPGSMHGLALMTSLLHMRAWPELLHSVRTGETAFAKVFGCNIFEYLPTDAEAARAFDAAMAGYTAMMANAVVAKYDFDVYGTVVDVGGGSGALIAAILDRFPRPRGVTFDLPHVSERARAALDRASLAGRAEVVGGDFFASVPAGDCYTLKHILHDWNDDKSRAIVRTLRKSIRPGGRVCVIESLIPPGNAPSPAKLFDLNMLVMAGGRERTEAEYAALFAATGFRLTRVVPCGPCDVIEAEPV